MKRTLVRAAGTLALLALFAGCSVAASTSSEDDYNHIDSGFAQMMIPHHADAVAMARVLLSREDLDTEVRDLAQAIVESQTRENTTMTAWLDDRGFATSDWEVDVSGAIAETEGFSTDQLRDEFLTGMIAHHDHGVMMSANAASRGINDEMTALAQTMTEVQTAEIEQMEALLAD